MYNLLKIIEPENRNACLIKKNEYECDQKWDEDYD
jgi:hypothetical protein